MPVAVDSTPTTTVALAAPAFALRHSGSSQPVRPATTDWPGNSIPPASACPRINPTGIDGDRSCRATRTGSNDQPVPD
ncbi:hypothetical protein D3C78_1323120 [compost metagenome]